MFQRDPQPCQLNAVSSRGERERDNLYDSGVRRHDRTKSLRLFKWRLHEKAD